MSSVHFIEVCSCGEVLAQCRCADCNKERIVKQKACAKCRQIPETVSAEVEAWRRQHMVDVSLLNELRAEVARLKHALAAAARIADALHGGEPR